MLVISNAEIIPNPVETGKSFIIKLIVDEIFANWGDVKFNNWSVFSTKTWDQINRKIF